MTQPPPLKEVSGRAAVVTGLQNLFNGGEHSSGAKRRLLLRFVGLLDSSLDLLELRNPVNAEINDIRNDDQEYKTHPPQTKCEHHVGPGGNDKDIEKCKQKDQ